MLKQDFLLRQIESLAMSLSKIFFNKEMVNYEADNKESNSQTDILYKKLHNLLLEGNINEAEDLLFDNIDKSDINYLKLGIDFYTTLNKFEDKVLEEHNYSREEIEQGLKDLSKEYGMIM